MMRRVLILLVVLSTMAWSLAPARLPASAQGPRTVTIGLYADAISLDPEDTNDNLSLSVERGILALLETIVSTSEQPGP